MAAHAKLLEAFQKEYWDFYKELLAYRQVPTSADAVRLEEKFDALFATVSGYDALDDRIQKTRAHMPFGTILAEVYYPAQGTVLSVRLRKGFPTPRIVYLPWRR